MHNAKQVLISLAAKTFVSNSFHRKQYLLIIVIINLPRLGLMAYYGPVAALKGLPKYICLSG
jgi:hypothetical protein